ncbi:MAG: glycoside hydrolase family 2 protein, partial [Spirochaetales bacterium]|nr:glycoside hydrolase family 2 protein [Spirochaetales bacterium]
VDTPYNNFDEKMYQKISYYKKEFDLQDIDDELYIKFNGVMSCAKVYINNHLVGEHLGGYTPFRFCITPYVKTGQNIVFVEVDSTEREDVPPFGFVVDYLTYGGIYREVELQFCNKIHIETCGIQTLNVLSNRPEIKVVINIINSKCEQEKIKIVNVITNKNKIVYEFSNNYVLNGLNREELTVSGFPRNFELWDLDNPNLYYLETRIYKNNELIESVQNRFGFREAKFTKEGFYLNGKKIVIRGLNRHQSFPYVGYAMPKNVQYKDVEILKYQLGLNCVRLSHYPQSDHFMDRCDELGLLVFDELPGWQHMGNENWQTNAIQSIKEMILKDQNHPSVIIWGVRINESDDNDIFYSLTNKTAKALDPIRATGGVRCIKNSNLLEDVYTYNDFSHTGKNPGLEKREKVTRKNVPYLVTEYNGHMFPSKKFDNEKHRVEHVKRHLNVLNSVKKNKLSGAIGWCMFDYNTHKDFGSGDKICYHGVMDMFRIPKDAAFVYSSQGSKEPVMHVASSLNIGENEGSRPTDIYVLTNCDWVDLYRNNSFIKRFYPNIKKYSFLDHPPIIIDDLIGDLIKDNEPFTAKDAERVKRVLTKASRTGGKLNIINKITMGILLIKYKLTQKDGENIYTKYFGGWGSKATTYKFEGYINNNKSITVLKSQVFNPVLEVKPDSYDLFEGITYDATRVVISLKDENNNPIIYANNSFNIEELGAIEIIGPKTISLIGGSIAFWVKTKGFSGKGFLKIKSHEFGNLEYEFNVIKETL